MGKRNKFLLIFLSGASFVIIILLSIIKVYDNHIDASYKVIEKNITESTKKCFLEGKCNGKEVILEDLIKKGYITKLIDPISKEYISLNTKIKYNDGSVSVNIR